MRKLVALLAAVAASPGFACGPDSSPAARTEPVRVGVLPDQDGDLVRARHRSLLEYLHRETGMEFVLEVPDSYEELIDAFVDGELDLAWLGGLAYVMARERSGAEPLVLRDVDLSFTSDILVNSHLDAESVRDLAGATFVFGPPLSTSGHLMPRAFLSEQDAAPEQFFSASWHSGGHDETAQMVQAGLADAGVANSLVVESMFEDGRLERAHVKILARTEPYRNFVWAASPTLDAGLRSVLVDSFLALDPVDPDDAVVLRHQGAGGFLPASPHDHEDIAVAAAAHGFLRAEERR